MTTQQFQEECDSRKISDLLRGTLSREEELAAEEHLSQCDRCAQQLERDAADLDVWDGARAMLAPDEFDGSPSLTSITSAFPFGLDPLEKTQTAEVLTREIRGWLDPTDDPKMLGRFAGYEIVGIIGHGGMAIVLKGFEASLNRYVAIKVMAPRLATSGAARQRFAREAQAAAAVLHENVVAIHRVDQFHGLPFLVMPYIAGTSLQCRLDQEGALPLKAVLRIGAQISAGLASAHQQGLVHRDIKPANILMDPGVERIKITDFGLARTADDASVTRTGIIAGTPHYMSPEQTRGEMLDARSDLFSLGCLMYTICTGREPFHAETSFGTMRRIAEGEPPAIADINPDIPDWLAAIIDKLLAKRPDDRFESAEQVSQLLEECLAHVQQPVAIPLPESVASLTKPQTATWFSSIGNRVLCGLALAGFAALAMMFAGLTNPPDIAGDWTGDDWGEVHLKLIANGKYEGSYTDTFKAKKGQITLKWSRIERRFNGKWGEGDDDRGGKLSVRLVDDEIRGGWTTSKNVNINAGVPRLADLLWIRKEKAKRIRGGEKLPKPYPYYSLREPRDYYPVPAAPPAKGLPDQSDPLLGTWQVVGVVEAEADAFEPKDGVNVKGFEEASEIYAMVFENQFVFMQLTEGAEATTIFNCTREGDHLIRLAAYGVDKTLDTYRIEFAADGLWLLAEHKPSETEAVSWFLRRSTMRFPVSPQNRPAKPADSSKAPAPWDQPQFAAPKFETPDALLAYQHQCVVDRNFVSYVDLMDDVALREFAGFHLNQATLRYSFHIIGLQPGRDDSLNTKPQSLMDPTTGLLYRSLHPDPPADADAAYLELLTISIDKSKRLSASEYRKRLALSANVLKNPRQFAVEMLILGSGDLDGQQPRFVVAEDPATATGTIWLGDTKQTIGLKKTEDGWVITSMFDDEYLAAAIEVRQMYEGLLPNNEGPHDPRLIPENTDGDP